MKANFATIQANIESKNLEVCRKAWDDATNKAAELISPFIVNVPTERDKQAICCELFVPGCNSICVDSKYRRNPPAAYVAQELSKANEAFIAKIEELSAQVEDLQWTIDNR